MSATKSPAAKRINFGKVELLAETPDLLGIQIQSFKDFFQLETTPDKRNNEGCSVCSRRIFRSRIRVTFSCWNSWIISLIRPVTPSKSVWNAA